MSSVYFDPAVGGNGTTVTDDSDATTGLGNGGHRTRFVPALSQVVAVSSYTVSTTGASQTAAANSASAAAASAATAVNAPGTSATSTTSLAIGTGSKSLTIQAGKSIVVGMTLKIAYTTTPTNWMVGDVTSYNSGTGALVVSVSVSNGSGTYAAWTVSLSAPMQVLTSGSSILKGNGAGGFANAVAATDYVAPIGSDGTVTRQMLKDCGEVYYLAGDVAAIDFANGSHQRWTPTGTKTLAISNWAPTGNLSVLMLEGVNLGAATLTWPVVNWIKPDGSTTTTFATAGVTLQSAGIDWVFVWTRDAGTTLYGKIVR